MTPKNRISRLKTAAQLLAALTLGLAATASAQVGLPYAEYFENGNGGYTHSGSNDEWEHGAPNVAGLTAGHNNSLYCWGTDLDGNYKNNSDQSLISPTIVLGSNPNVKLSFWHIAKTEKNKDKGYVEVSVNGGLTWSALDEADYEGASRNFRNKGYFSEGSYRSWSDGIDNASWKMETFSLARFAGQTIQIRFRLTSNRDDTMAGWYIDDIKVLSTLMTGFDEDANLTDGAALDVNSDTGGVDIAELGINQNQYTGFASLQGVLIEGNYPEAPLPNAAAFWWDMHSDGDENWSGVMTLHYNEALLNGIPESRISVSHWNGYEWENFGGVVDEVNNTVTVYVARDQFSPYMLGEEPSGGSRMAGGSATTEGKTTDLRNYPNPFSGPTTTIAYQLVNPTTQPVKLQVFNAAGQLIKTLINEPQQAGQYSVVWDARNERNEQVGAGVYLYRLSVGSSEQTTRRMVMLK